MTIPADPKVMVDADDPRVLAVVQLDPRVAVDQARYVLGTLDDSGFEDSADGALHITLDGYGEPLTWSDLEDSGVKIGRNGAGTIVALECNGMVTWG